MSGCGGGPGLCAIARSRSVSGGEVALDASADRLALSSKADGVLICGDFNMTPDSALYHYMIKGELDVDGLDRWVKGVRVGSDGFRLVRWGSAGYG